MKWAIIYFIFVPASSTQESTYGHSWMHNASKSCLATDAASRAPCQEHVDYLAAPLEDVNDIVAWWGVSIVFISFGNFWMYSTDVHHFTATFYAVPTIARIAKDYPAIQGSAVPSEWAFSGSVLTATACCNCLLSNTFWQLQLLKSAYHEGHISAASKAELVFPCAHSLIIFE